MKKLFLFLIVLLVSANAFAAESMKTQNIWSGTLAASGVIEKAINQPKEGFLSIQPVFTGSGTLKIDYQTSNNNQDWTTAVQIVASAASGEVYRYPASGVNIFAYYHRIVMTETSGTDSVLVSGVYGCVQ